MKCDQADKSLNPRTSFKGIRMLFMGVARSPISNSVLKVLIENKIRHRQLSSGGQ